MADLPPEYGPLMDLAEAELKKAAGQLKPSAVLKQIYKELVFQFAQAGGTVEQFNGHLMFYTALNVLKVLSRVQQISVKNPPTHRKGRGKDGGITVMSGQEWIFYFDGTQGGGKTGNGEEENSEEYGGVLDWAPDSEQARARAMMAQVAAETGFGEGDDQWVFTREVARRLGGRWGMNGKRGNPNDPSGDILAWDIPGFAPQLFDILIASGEENRLAWQPVRYSPVGAVWLAP
jgi:hypothetical protein